MSVSLRYIVIIFSAIWFIASCGQKGDDGRRQPDKLIYKDQMPGRTFSDTYQSYFKTSIDELRQRHWAKFSIDTVNDEFEKWIEAKFYSSRNDWILVEAADMNTTSIFSIETNTSNILNDCPFKIGDHISSVILRDSAEFSFDRGEASLIVGKYEIKSACLGNISNIEYDQIIEARRLHSSNALPKKISSCAISSIRIANVK